MKPSTVQHYPFSYALPKYLPSSFDHSYGKVQYYLEAKTMTTKSCCVVNVTSTTALSKVHFNYHEPLDIRSIHLSGITQVDEGHNYCNSGVVSMCLVMDQRSYTPGQDVKMCIKIDNRSSSTLKGPRVSLIQKITFIAKEWTEVTVRRKERNLLHTAKANARIGPRSVGVWKPVLPIPNYTLQTCSELTSRTELIITVEYFVKVVIELTHALSWVAR